MIIEDMLYNRNNCLPVMCISLQKESKVNTFNIHNGTDGYNILCMLQLIPLASSVASCACVSASIEESVPPPSLTFN